MSVAVSSAVWAKAQVKGAPLLVLLALADNADDDGRCFPSVLHVARKTRMTQRGVQKVMRELQSLGVLTVSPRSGPNGSNLYKLVTGAFTEPPQVKEDESKSPNKRAKGPSSTPNNVPPEHGSPLNTGAPTRGTKVHVPGNVGVSTPRTLFPLTVKEPSIEPSREPSSLAPRSQSDSAQDRGKLIGTLPLIGKQGDFEVFEADLRMWQEAFPAVDVKQQLREVKAWSVDNPKRRKTRTGIRRFVNSWLSREQDRAGGNPRGQFQSPTQQRHASHGEAIRDIQARRMDAAGQPPADHQGRPGPDVHLPPVRPTGHRDFGSLHRALSEGESASRDASP